MANSKKTTDTKSTPKKRLNLYSLEKEVYRVHERVKSDLFQLELSTEERIKMLVEENIKLENRLEQLNEMFHGNYVFGKEFKLQVTKQLHAILNNESMSTNFIINYIENLRRKRQTSRKDTFYKDLLNYSNLPWYTRWSIWARELGYLFFNPEAVVKLKTFRLLNTNK